MLRPTKFFAPLAVFGGTAIIGILLIAFNQSHNSIPNTDVNPLCANFFLQQEVEAWKKDKTLQMAQDAGIAWAKQQFAWEEAEPRKGEFNWRKFDELVGLFEKYHLQIIARLDRPPNWTKKDPRFRQGPPDNLSDFGDFVFAFVSRYKGRVHYIQLWNEPNLWNEWGGRPPNASQYLALLKVGYTRAKEADPIVQVLMAPLAPTLEESSLATTELNYLDQLYQLGAKDYFDILAASAFGQEFGPDDPPQASVLNFSRVVLQRNIMEKYDDTRKAIWLNEYGWNASPASFPKSTLTWQRVSEEEQAAYTIRGLEKARNDWPWAGPLCIWYFRQVGNIPPERPDYYFRMVDADFTPRLVYEAIKKYAGK
jgi:polysaccharide biosynthesis protein PslG